MGFFTDTTVCIGCKACEVACKQWNDLPADGGATGRGGSYDHTGSLSAVDLAPRALRRARRDARRSTLRWRPLEATERRRRSTTGCSCPTSASTARTPAAWTPARPARSSAPSSTRSWSSPTSATAAATASRRARSAWSTATPTTAAPPSARSVTTASRTGWSRPARRRARPTRSSSGPTTSSSTWPQRRVASCTSAASTRAYLYGADDAPEDELAGGLGAFFLLTEPPERYGLPAQADSPIQENVVPATLAAVGAGLLAAAGVRRRVSSLGAAAMSDLERDTTPAVGDARAQPALGAREPARARSTLHIGHVAATGAGRTSTATTRRTAARRPTRGRSPPPPSARAPDRCPSRSRGR